MGLRPIQVDGDRRDGVEQLRQGVATSLACPLLYSRGSVTAPNPARQVCVIILSVTAPEGRGSEKQGSCTFTQTRQGGAPVANTSFFNGVPMGLRPIQADGDRRDGVEQLRQGVATSLACPLLYSRGSVRYGTEPRPSQSV